MARTLAGARPAFPFPHRPLSEADAEAALRAARRDRWLTEEERAVLRHLGYRRRRAGIACDGLPPERPYAAQVI